MTAPADLGLLARLGIRRVSTRSLPYRAAIDAAVTVATQVRDGRKPPTATPYPQARASLPGTPA